MSNRGRTSGGSALTASSPERATYNRGARRRVLPRILLLAFAVASMAAGLYAGLMRLGFDLPDGAGLADIHGPLMICGVFGTLISLERAVAIGLGWPYLAPAGFAVSALLMLSGFPVPASVAALGAAAVFLAATLWIAARQPALFTLVLAAGTAMLVVGCALWWLGVGIRGLAAWWLGFLVLTIAAERLELSRIIRQGRVAQWLFLVSVAVIATGAALGLQSDAGGAVLGTGFLATAAWLGRHDVAMRTVCIPGQPRFMASAMLAGYGWLALTGGILAFGTSATFGYDLALHGVLIGFVLSMVFGHALIIFPAIGGVALLYRPALYLPLLALHLAVTLRVAGGLLEIEVLRLASGPLTLLAVVGFAALLASGRRLRTT